MDDKRHSLLLTSYETFKKDVKSNHEKLGDIVIELFTYDGAEAVEKWKELLKSNLDFLRTNEHAYWITRFWTRDLDDDEEAVLKAADAIWADDELLRLIFQEACNIGCCNLLQALLLDNRLIELNKAYALMYTNPNLSSHSATSCPFGDFFSMTLPDLSWHTITPEAGDLLEAWAEKVKPEEKRLEILLRVGTHVSDDPMYRKPKPSQQILSPDEIIDRVKKPGVKSAQETIDAKLSRHVLPDSLIERDLTAEKRFGIDDIKFYCRENGGSVSVVGELFSSKKILKPFNMACSAFDTDGKRISSDKSGYFYFGITSKVFFNGMPFSLSFSLGKTPLSRLKAIKVFPVEET